MARKLEVEIVGDSRSLEAAFGRSAKSAEGFGQKMQAVGKGMQKVGKSLSLFVTAPVVAFGALSVKAAMDAEQAMATVSKSFKNAGIPVEAYTKTLKAAGEEAVQLGFDDEEAAQSLGKFALVTRDAAKAHESLQAAENLSRATGKDLSATTSILLGAMTGQARSLKTLGITYIPVTTNMRALTAAHKAAKTPITEMEARTAKLADKQMNAANILKLVERNVRGQAQAFSETAAGGMARFRERLENLEEGIGNLLLPAMEKMVGWLQQGMKWFDGLSDSTKKLIAIGAGIAAALGPTIAILGTLTRAVGGLSRAMLFLAANPVVLLVSAIAILGGAMAAATFAPDQFRAVLEKFGVSADAAGKAITGLQAAFKVFSAIINTALFPFRTAFETLIRSVVATAKLVIDLIHGDWSKAWQDFKELALAPVKALWAGLTAIVPNLGSLFNNAWSAIKSGASSAWGTIKSTVSTAAGAVVSALTTAAGKLAAPFKTAWDAIVTAANTAWSSLKTIGSKLASVFQGAVQGIKTAMGNIALAIVEPLSSLPGRFGQPFTDAVQAIKKWMGEGKTEGSKGGSGIVDATAKAMKPFPGSLSGPVKAGVSQAKASWGSLPASATVAGVGVGSGMARGIRQNIGAAVAAAQALTSAVKAQLGGPKFGSTPQEWAAKYSGSALMRGIAKGIFEAMPEVKSATDKAKNLLKAQLQAGDVMAAVQAAGKTIGLGHAQSIVQGIIAGSPSIAQQIKQALREATQQAIADSRAAVVAAKETFASAFGELASAALAAFDAVAAKWKPPAQKIIDAEAMAKQIQALSDAAGPEIAAMFNKINDLLAKGNENAANKVLKQLDAALKAQIAVATGAVATAQAAVDALPADATEEQRKQAQDALTLAQTNLAALQAARDQALQTIATNEATAHAKIMEQKRQHFQQELEQLRTWGANHANEHDKIQKKIVALLQKYGIKGGEFWKAGQALGFAIADGLRDAIKAVEKAADELAAAIKKRLPSSPPKEGPLAGKFLIQSGEKIGSMIAEGLAKTSPLAALDTSLRMPAPAAGGARGIGGLPSRMGPQTIQVVIDRRVIGEVVRDELGRIKHRNGTYAI